MLMKLKPIQTIDMKDAHPHPFSPRCLRPVRSWTLKAFALLAVLSGSLAARGQARATASRLADVQVGADFINGNSDYARSRFNGYGVYADMDFHRGFGVEAEYRYMSDGDPYPQTNVYERTYQIGGRYSRQYGRFQPFAKLLVGRGTLNYPYDLANVGYNMGTIGGGTDFRVLRHVNARVDYEYQKWFSVSRNAQPFTPNDSLTPSLLSLASPTTSSLGPGDTLFSNLESAGVEAPQEEGAPTPDVTSSASRADSLMV